MVEMTHGWNGNNVSMLWPVVVYFVAIAVLVGA